jgi:hypothetical protein
LFTTFLPLILIWLLCGVYFAVEMRKSSHAGFFSMLYFLATFLAFVPGAALRLFPGTNFLDDEEMLVGLRISTIGIIAFTLASNFARGKEGQQEKQYRRTDPEVLRRWLMYFSGFAILVAPVLKSVTSIGSLVVNAAVCVLAVLLFRGPTRQVSNRMFWAVIVICVIAPFYSVIAMGYLGVGVGVSMMLGVVLYREANRIPKAIALVVPLLVYVGLSLFVTYNRDRADIREKVWETGDGIADQSRFVLDRFSQFDWFDPTEDRHRAFVEGRLSQCSLVGAAKAYIESGYGSFFEFQTLTEALIAPIPRLIWRDKPYKAGSGTYVSQATGIYFDENTSVGLTHLMEFYLAFGIPSLVIGMAAMGYFVRRIDNRLAESQSAGDYLTLTGCFVIGQTTLSIAGSLAEFTSTLVAAWVVMQVVKAGYVALAK